MRHRAWSGTRFVAAASGWAWISLAACSVATEDLEELGSQQSALTVIKSFQDGSSPTGSYGGTRDTYISEDASTSNFGGPSVTTCIADGDAINGKDQFVLLRWAFTHADIPADATVTSVSMTLNVTNPTGGGGYNIYALKKNWVETEATWNIFATGNGWELAGAHGASDRGSTLLGTLAPTTTGLYTVNLNSAGVALVQGWVDDPLANYGIIIANTANADGMGFSARSDPTPSLRPKLTINYAVTNAASTYYVDPTGNDANDGTSPATAWKTLKRVTDAVLAPGDSVLLKRGATWTEALVMAESGTSSAPIRVGAYGSGANPVINGGNTISTAVRLTGSYLRIEDLTIQDATWAGVRMDGDFNVIERNVITRNVVGIQIQPGADNNKALRNTLTDNNKMSVVTPCNVNCDDDSGAFGVVLQGNQNEIAYNTIAGSVAPSPDYEYDGAAVEIYGGQYNSIHHNMTYDNQVFTELGGGTVKASDNTFSYNLVRAAATAPLYRAKFLVTRGAGNGFGPVYRTKAYNNTVHLAGTETEGFVCHAGCSNDILTLRNNVIQAVKKTGYADALFDEGHGLYWGGINQFTMGTGSVRQNPLFVSAATGDLHLQATSPGLESGTSANGGFTTDLDGLGLPFDFDGNGSAGFDKGCYEKH